MKQSIIYYSITFEASEKPSKRATKLLACWQNRNPWENWITYKRGLALLWHRWWGRSTIGWCKDMQFFISGPDSILNSWFQWSQFFLIYNFLLDETIELVRLIYIKSIKFLQCSNYWAKVRRLFVGGWYFFY